MLYFVALPHHWLQARSSLVDNSSWDKPAQLRQPRQIAFTKSMHWQVGKYAYVPQVLRGLLQ